MSDPKDDGEGEEAVPGERRAGLAGTPAKVGRELGGLDFETDALLDSLTDDDDRPTNVGEDPAAREPKSIRGAGLPVGPKLHEPTVRQYSQDEVTMVTRDDSVSRALREAMPELRTEAGDEVDELDELLGGPAASPDDAPPPLPMRSAIPRPGLQPQPTARKQTLAGLQPIGAKAAGIPRPSIPRAGGFTEPGRPQDPALEPATPKAPNVATQSDEEEESTQVFSSGDLDRTLKALEHAAPLSSPLAARQADSLPESTVVTSGEIVSVSELYEGGDEAVVTAAELGAEELSDDGFDSILPNSNFPEQEPATSAVPPRRPALDSVTTVKAEDVAPFVPAAPLYEKQHEERPAAQYLREGGNAAAFVARAEWFETEARAKSDAQTRARLWLAASELWALVGDMERAKSSANEAATAGRTMPLPARQARWLAAVAGDYKIVAHALEMEIRGSPTPEARVHAAYLSAEVHRLALKDDASAKKKLDLAVRAQADDPRAALYRFADALAKSAGPPKFKWPEQPGFETLSAASDELVARRSGQTPTADAAPPALLAAARRMLKAGNRTAAAKLFEQLGKVEGLGPAGAWLAAALLAHEAGTRADAIRLLGPLTSGKHPELARRALASRALEQGDASALSAAIRSGDEAFTAADRVSLAALTGAPLEVMDGLVAELAAQEGYAALASAAHVAAGSPNALGCGTPSARAEALLGRTIGRAPQGYEGGLAWLRGAVESYEETHREQPLTQLLLLELALRANAALPVATALGEWPLSANDVRARRDRDLARGLVLELGGGRESARPAYLAALEADAGSEAAVRALLTSFDADRYREAVLGLAEASRDRSQSALYCLEALLGAPLAEPSDARDLLQRAILADPTLPLAYRIAEQFARSRGDAEDLAQWLRARREVSGDDFAKALDLVREALLVAEHDLSRAAELLSDAIRTRPSDVGLRELFERLRPGADSERGAWRESVAEQSADRTKAMLLLQAAFEYERAGERASAARAARAAVDAGAGALATTMALRTAIGTPEAARVSEDLLARAKEAPDAVEQRELYEQLSEFDRARGDASSAILWQGAILERSPEHLPALRRLEHSYISAARDDELEPIAAALAKLLSDGEGEGHARLAARFRRKSGSWLLVREMAELAAKRPEPPLWALRLLSGYARTADDPALALLADEQLLARVDHPLDKATLALRSAEASARAGDLGHARELLEKSLEHAPDHLVTLTTLAEILEAAGDFKGAAKALEAVGEASSIDGHKVGAWHQAGIVWLEKAGDPARGRLALEQAVAMDPSHEDAVLRLQALYISEKDAGALAGLLERRLERATDPEERVALEVARSRALTDVGEKDAAKAALTAALDANPEHIEALQALADLCASEGDWAGAEQAFIRLARHAAEPRRQAEIYKKLGELYDGPLPNPARAELSYQEVLKRDPDDPLAVERLIAVYGRLQQPAKAIELATKLLERAASSEEKRDRTLALAVVYEQIVGDRKKADATFDKARKEWAHDGVVLRALVEHHLRAGEARAVQVLLDRSATDARRALATGRFEPAFFDILGTVAELRGSLDMAAVANATLAALRGQPMVVSGAGAGAFDVRLDDLLAPELLTPALRALLKKCADVLDIAYPVDLNALRAERLGVDGYAPQAHDVAAGFGLHNVEFYVSPALGATCLAVGSQPPRVVFGASLLASTDDAAKYFLLVRALKLVQEGATAFARVPPIELAPAVAGFLSTFAPNWVPQGVDAKKVADAQRRMQLAVQRELDNDVPVLALEVIGSLGNRATQLGTALLQWGDRVALLAMGDVLAALRALGLGTGSGSGLPAEGAERLKWIVRNPEARDLTVFAVSEQHAEARARFGLSG